MKMYGIPASIILAQGILEGEKDLANRANNHFDIKCQ
jgi:flagellum-specific peptidoglycan hydrolase FlgJ